MMEAPGAGVQEVAFIVVTLGGDEPEASLDTLEVPASG